MGLGPMGLGPMGLGPMGLGPMGQGPMGQGPMGQGPMGQGPMGPGPMGQGPMGQGPIDPGPTGLGPMGLGPMGLGPMGPTPMPESIKITPYMPQPLWEASGRPWQASAGLRTPPAGFRQASRRRWRPPAGLQTPPEASGGVRPKKSEKRVFPKMLGIDAPGLWGPRGPLGASGGPLGGPWGPLGGPWAPPGPWALSGPISALFPGVEAAIAADLCSSVSFIGELQGGAAQATQTLALHKMQRNERLFPRHMSTRIQKTWMYKTHRRLGG